MSKIVYVPPGRSAQSVRDNLFTIQVLYTYRLGGMRWKIQRCIFNGKEVAYFTEFHSATPKLNIAAAKNPLNTKNFLVIASLNEITKKITTKDSTQK